MELPLVTIGAINYNNEPYVLETLDSIAAQTYPNIELIMMHQQMEAFIK
jgi:glycosyltransferase involved in cell wall biosynthesis